MNILKNDNPQFSVIILTKNESTNISSCISSLGNISDVHLLDSGSTDTTVEIAKALGVRAHQNQFEGFGTQRNWAIDNIPAQHDWQFHLDADERLTPELIQELNGIIRTNPTQGGFRVPSKLMFGGRWLKRAGQYPAYQVRFFHRARLRFENHGHGQREVSEHPIGVLQNPIIHFGFSKGIDDWFRKHVGYARREAEKAISSEGGQWSGLFARDSVKRRRSLKSLVGKLPGRYFLRLSYMLFWKLAFLDGRPGITYAHMLAAYEGMIDVYLRALSYPEAGPGDPSTLKISL